MCPVLWGHPRLCPGLDQFHSRCLEALVPWVCSVWNDTAAPPPWDAPLGAVERVGAIPHQREVPVLSALQR